VTLGTEGLALQRRLKERAGELGFALFGIAPATPSGHVAAYERWLSEGRHGTMAYLAREDSVGRRSDLRGTFRDVRSVVVVGHEYYLEEAEEGGVDPSLAIIARYARGNDYHDVVKRKLLELLSWLDTVVPGGVEGRAYVDTGPILERELGQRAGLGWFGRNTMLINPARGSYFFLGVLLVDHLMTPTRPFAEDRCGSCSACLDACPTGALLGRDADGAPIMDARRCISYLTIELRGPIPIEMRRGIGNRVFGCDICQEVCPWNARFAHVTAEPGYAPRPGLSSPALTRLAAQLLDLDEEGFRIRFRGSPLRRAKRVGLLRNVCVAMGNLLRNGSGADEQDVLDLLGQALSDVEPLVQGHAAWALGQCGSDAARSHLQSRARRPMDGFVRREIAKALAQRPEG
jgi:epoxyqueuosine reductase